MKKTRVFEPVRLGRKPSRDKHARLAAIGTYDVRYECVVNVKLDGLGPAAGDEGRFSGFDALGRPIAESVEEEAARIAAFARLAR